MKAKQNSLKKKIIKNSYSKPIKIISIAGTTTGGVALAATSVFSSSSGVSNSQKDLNYETVDNENNVEDNNPSFENDQEGSGDGGSSGGGGGSSGGGGGSSGGGGGGSAPVVQPQPTPDQMKQRLFGDWLQTDEAKSTYETWRTSKEGVKSLKESFAKSDEFNRELTSWSRGQKRDQDEFKSEALQSDQYKEKFKTNLKTQQGLETWKNDFKASAKYNEKKQEWINKSSSPLTKKQWYQTQNFTTHLNRWKADAANQQVIENKWKLSSDYQNQKTSYLSKENQKLDKDNWLSVMSGQKAFQKWKTNLPSNESLISYWKTTQNYQEKLKQWKDNVYVNGMSIDDFKANENHWNLEYTKFKNSDKGNKKIENAVVNRTEYINAKNAWSRSGKNQWKQTSDFTTKYNAWRTSDTGRENLKATYLTTFDYGWRRNNWLLNDYANKKPFGYWAALPEATSAFNNWKTNTYSEDEAKTYWQTLSDYETKRDLWINNNGPSINKSTWDTTVTAQNAYNTWKVKSESEKALKADWETKNDYATKRDNWIVANPAKRDKDVWLSLSEGAAAYNSWKTSFNAVFALKIAYFKTQDYLQKRDNWILNNYQNKRSQNQWNNLDAAKNSYKKWETTAGASKILKAAWETTSDYTNKRDTWISNNKPSKSFWNNTKDALDNYNFYKISNDGDVALKTHWETTSDYTNKSDTWIVANNIQNNPNKHSLYKSDAAYQSDFESWRDEKSNTKTNGFIFYLTQPKATSAYNNWTHTSSPKRSYDYWEDKNFDKAFEEWKSGSGEKALIKEWEKSSDYLKNLKLYAFNEWKVKSESLAAFESHWKKTNHYVQSKKAWINSDAVNRYYNNWKNSQAGQDYLKVNFKASSQFNIAMNNWFDNPGNNLDDIKRQWFFNNYKSSDQVGFENELKSHFQTTQDFRLKRDKWIGARNNLTKVDWKNSNHFNTSYNTFKNSDYGIQELYAEFKKGSAFKSAYNNFKRTNYVKRSKSEWVGTTYFDFDYENWKESSEGRAAVVADFKNSPDYQKAKTDFINSGVLTKRTIDEWILLDDSNATYNKWKNSAEARATSLTTWKATRLERYGYEWSYQAWYFNQDSAFTSQTWRENYKKELFELDTTAFNQYLKNWLSIKTNGQSIFKTTKLAIDAYNNWNDTTKAPASADNYDGSEQFEKDLKAYLNKASNQNQKVGYNLYMNTAQSTTKYNDWTDRGQLDSFKQTPTYLNLYNSFINGNDAKNLFFNNKVSEIDYNSWVPSSLINNYLTSSDFTNDYQNYKMQFKNNLTDFVAYFDNDQNLVNAFKNELWDTKIANFYQMHSTFATDVNNWASDRNNGKKSYTIHAQSETDYQGHNQYQNDFSTYQDKVESGETKNNFYNFYLKEILDWENSQDYETKRNDWIANNQNYNHLTKEEWIQTAGGIKAFTNFKNKNSNLELFKNYYMTTQDYTNNQNTWIANNPSSKEDWTQSDEFTTAFNNYVNDSNNENELITFWKTTQDFADAKALWTKRSYLPITKEDWRNTQDFADKYKIWKNQRGTYEKLRATWLKTEHYTNSLLRYRMKNKLKAYKRDRRDIDFWYNSPYSDDAYRDWRTSSEAITNNFDRWKTNDARDYNKKRDEWFARSNPSWDTLAKYTRDNGYQYWRSRQNLPSLKRTWEATSEYAGFAKKYSADFDEWIISKKQTIKDWAYNMSKYANMNKRADFYVTHSNGYRELMPGYWYWQLVFWALDHYHPSWKVTRNNALDWLGAATTVSSGPSRISEDAKNYKEALLQALNNSNIRGNTSFLANLRKLWIQEENITESNSEYISWYKNRFKSHRYYNTKFEQWLKKRYERNKPDLATQYKQHKDTEFARSSNNYGVYVSMWLGDKSKSLDLFKNSAQATSAYNSWTDPNKLILAPESDYYGSVTDADFKEWLRSDSYEKIKKQYYYASTQARNDLTSYRNTLVASDYENDNQFNLDFNAFKTNDLMKKYYLSKGVATTDYNNWTDPKSGQKYNLSLEFRNNLTQYKNQNQNNNLSNLANYFLNLSSTEKLFQEAKTKKADQAFKASNEYQTHLNSWKTTNEINNNGSKKWINSQTETDYQASSDFATNLNTWKDTIKPNETQTNAKKIYIDDDHVKNDYNNWYDDYSEKKYKATPEYQNYFEAWRDKTTNNKTNGFAHYLTTDQATSDYNAWADPNGESQYLTTSDYTNSYATWSSDETNIVNTYKESKQSDNAYNQWNDPSPLPNDEAGYKDSDDYQNDFESAYRDDLVANQNNGFNFYLSHNDSTKDYQSWAKTNGEKDYQNNAAYQSDFETWRDGMTNNKTNKFLYFLSTPAAINQYNQWIDPSGESDYLASNEFTKNLDNWSQGEDSNKVKYLNSNEGINDWLNILDSKFAKTSQGQTLMNDLKLNYSKEIYKNSSEFQQYFNNWNDPNIADDDKYKLHSTFVDDHNKYYETIANQYAAYKNNAQSDVDYNTYLNDLKDESDYLNSASKNVDLLKWRNVNSNIVDIFKNNANTLTLFQNFNNNQGNLTRTEELYLLDNQFTFDLKTYVNQNFDFFFEKYLTNNLNTLYQNWVDPRGITPDGDLFKNHNDYLQFVNTWSSIMANGLQDFMVSKLAKEVFEKSQV